MHHRSGDFPALVYPPGVKLLCTWFAKEQRGGAVGVLLASAVISALGLYLYSIANSPGSTLFAAIVFAVGVCYFWPTMLGFVSERTPQTGALGLSIMGGAGMVATSFVLPIMGHSIDTAGPQQTLRFMTVLPVILIAAFVLLAWYLRGRRSGNAH